MPELPEVQTVISTLKKQLAIKTIKDVDVYWDNIIAYPSVKEFKKIIRNKSIVDYNRYGKYLIFDLKTHVMIVHLRMEGKFYILDEAEPYSKHAHVVFHLSEGKFLQYIDTRKFGKMYIYEKVEDLHSYSCFKNIGYDAFDVHCNAQYLYVQAKKSTLSLKAFLLNQKIMAGVGNIYADEICFAMRLHPEYKVKNFTKDDAAKCLIETRRILNEAINCGGTTIRSYTSSLKVDGRFQLKLQVHMRKGEACPVCANVIEKITVATRGTYYCKKCQSKKC